jgi:hypothetical protein
MQWWTQFNRDRGRQQTAGSIWSSATEKNSTVLDGWRNRQIQMMYSMDPDVQDLEVSIQYMKPGNKWMYNTSN